MEVITNAMLLVYLCVSNEQGQYGSENGEQQG
jgi:hypothetical protein